MADGAPAGGGGALAGLKHKIGPLPLWGWMAGGLGGALAYALYKQRKAAAAAATTSGTGTSTSGEVPADQVPDVIIQNNLAGPGTTGATTGGRGGSSKTPPTTKGHIGAGGTPATPGIHEYSGNGKLTLNQLAKQHHTTPAAIIAATRKNKNNISKSLSDYLDKGDFGKPIPKGDTVIY